MEDAWEVDDEEQNPDDHCGVHETEFMRMERGSDIINVDSEISDDFPVARKSFTFFPFLSYK